MKDKKDLEETLRGKVAGLVEESMTRSLGITIPQMESDITDKLRSHLSIYVALDTTFNEAKKRFKAEFLKSELKLHKGNISQLAKFLGLDRRSIHRVIKDLDIKVEVLRDKSKEYHKEDIIDQTIRSALDEYKEIIQPGKMEKFYEEVPALSRNIAKILPRKHLTWKQAEKEFEKQFLLEVMEDNYWSFAKAAKKIDIRPETLHRKVKKLELRRSTVTVQ